MSSFRWISAWIGVAMLWLAAGWILAARRDAAGPACATETSSPAPPRRTTFAPLRRCDESVGECRRKVEICREATAECARASASARPLDERFAAATPGESGGGALIARIEAAFRDRPGVEIRPECRGALCRIEVAGDDIGKIGEILNGAIGDLVVASEFSADMRHRSRPRMIAFAEVRPPDLPSGIELLRGAFERMRASGALARCHAQAPEDGQVIVYLNLDAETGISMTLGGTLGLRPAGTCIGDAMRYVLAEIEVPARIAPAVFYGRVTLPPPSN